MKFAKKMLKEHSLLQEDRPDDIAEALDRFIDDERLRFEGERALDNFNKICQAIGYHDYESFFSDNPGVFDAMIEWIKDNDYGNHWFDEIMQGYDEDFMDDLQDEDDDLIPLVHENGYRAALNKHLKMVQIEVDGNRAYYDPKNSKWMDSNMHPLPGAVLSLIRRQSAHKKMLDILKTQLGKLHESKYLR